MGPWVKAEQMRAKITPIKTQRLACITGIMSTALTEAMEIMPGLPPIDLFIIAEARKAANRVKSGCVWRTLLLKHTIITATICHIILRMGTDKTDYRYSF